MAKKTILFVEDEAPLRDALVDVFTQEGYLMLVAEDGSDGLTIAFEKHPDLILLDIIMPKMHGMDMLAKLRKDSWGKNVPVIVLSNLSSPQDVEATEKAGVSDFLIKANYDLKQIADVVKKKLS